MTTVAKNRLRCTMHDESIRQIKIQFNYRYLLSIINVRLHVEHNAVDYTALGYHSNCKVAIFFSGVQSL